MTYIIFKCENVYSIAYNVCKNNIIGNIKLGYPCVGENLRNSR